MRILLGVLFLAGFAISASAQNGAVEAEEEIYTHRYFNVFDNIQIGLGLATFMGPMDGNPENKPLHFAARANPSFFLSGSRAIGAGVTLVADLSYERVTGVRSRDRVGGEVRRLQFSNNLLSASFLATYDFGSRGYVGAFLGGGPTLLINPKYDFDGLTNDNTPDTFGQLRGDLGTRPIVSTTVGLIVFEQLRVGFRMPITKYLDGWEGNLREERTIPYDLIMYVHFGFTLEQLNDAFGSVFQL